MKKGTIGGKGRGKRRQKIKEKGNNKALGEKRREVQKFSDK